MIHRPETSSDDSLPIPQRKRERLALPDLPRDPVRPTSPSSSERTHLSSSGDGASGRGGDGESSSSSLPAFLPLNVYLGVPVSSKTGKPRSFRPDAPPKVSAAENPTITPAERRQRRKTWGKRVLATTAICTVLLVLIGAGWLFGRMSDLNRTLPALPTRPAATLPEASVILAADGSQLGTLFDERRTWVPLDHVAPVVSQALLAAEDHRFESHQGVDWYRMAGAFWSTLIGDPEGASTIPMQLARNYYPELKTHSLVDRKIEEILLARRISKAMSKKETLEWYLNTVAFGHNSFGIEAAAERFYSRSSSELTLSQAALLVGMLQAPSRLDPLKNAGAARERRNVVLRRMADLGMITDREAQDTSRLPLNLQPRVFDPADSFAPYFLDYVRKEAETWARNAGFDLRNDGLVIHTSIQPELQKLAEDAVREQTSILQNILLQEFGAPGSVRNERFWRVKRAVEEDLIRGTAPYKALRNMGRTDHDALLAVRSDHAFVQTLREKATRLQGAMVVMDPGSGQILAWVGGHDYRTDQFDKVSSARRQPGSIFKPILYARALEDGYSPYYLVSDEVRTFVTDTRGERWTPTNSGGGASGRLVTLEQGLIWSKNTVSAHLISKIGPKDVIDLAHEMGITSSMMPVPSLALGTSETSLLEMVNTYATLADYGVHRKVTSITTITDRDGNLVATFPSEPDRVLSEQTSYTMVRILQKAVDQGTGRMLRTRFGVRGEIAGKTGTTQNNADGWFVGMHPDAVVGAWVGFNDQRISFQSNYWGQGGHNALLLVGDFLKSAQAGPGAHLPPGRFERPDGYVEPARPVYSVPAQERNMEGDPEDGMDTTPFSPAVRAPQSLPLQRPATAIRPAASHFRSDS